MKMSNSERLLMVLKIALIIALMILVVFPLLWLVLSAFKPEKEILAYPPALLGTKYSLKSFERIFKNIPMTVYIKNTVIFAFSTTALALLFDSLAGYAFARLHFKGKNYVFILYSVNHDGAVSNYDDSAVFRVSFYGIIKYIPRSHYAQDDHSFWYFHDAIILFTIAERSRRGRSGRWFERIRDLF